jgi:hypothetical protein
MARLLGGQQSGRPLEPNVRAQMENAFATDFEHVQVYDDTAAQQSATALDAAAFTHGEHIYLGPGSPPIESAAGKSLLAHELAHVVQQRTAEGIPSTALSQPGDRFERTADAAAQQVMQGGQAQISTTGTPPAVQRQQQPGNRATRDEVRVALEAFLRRAMQTQGGRTLRVTPEIRSAVTSLFIGDIGRLMGIEAWLSSPALPGDPAEFAREVARRLPDTIDRARLDHLNRLSGRAPTPSLPGRIRELAESSAPGEPERPAMPSAAEEAQQRAEKEAQLLRQGQGTEEPTEIGPVPVDLPRVGRILRGLPEAIRGPRTPRPTPPEARTYPQVEQAMRQIAPDALIPAEARGTPQASAFADAHEVARDLARRLDIAQQQGQDTITLRLGDNYNGVRDRRAMIDAAERIIQLIREALPHHASSVKYVDVYFGERLVTRGVV